MTSTAQPKFALRVTAMPIARTGRARRHEPERPRRVDLTLAFAPNPLAPIRVGARWIVPVDAEPCLVLSTRSGQAAPLCKRVRAAAPTAQPAPLSPLVHSRELAIHFATSAWLWRWLCGGFSGEAAVGVRLGRHRALQEAVEK
jgi:hypothetical protein